MTSVPIRSNDISSSNSSFENIKNIVHNAVLSTSMLHENVEHDDDDDGHDFQDFFNEDQSYSIPTRILPFRIRSSHDDVNMPLRENQKQCTPLSNNSTTEPTPIGDTNSITIVPAIPLGTHGLSKLLEAGVYDMLCCADPPKELSGNWLDRTSTHQDCSPHVEGMQNTMSQDKVVSIESIPCKHRHQNTITKRCKQKESLKRYQDIQWQKRFEELLAFYRIHGHCIVPSNHPQVSNSEYAHDDSVTVNDQVDDRDDDNKHQNEKNALSQWVKRQRYQYKLKRQGRRHALSDERESKLEAIGFCWNSHSSAWDAKYATMLQFFHIHGHSDVPSYYPDDMSLSVWVKCQRRQMKLWRKTGKSTLTLKRKEALDALGFNWNPRKL